MCLVAIAHRTSSRFPLVLAANRDEDYERPTEDAHFWDDAPDVLGGRDAVAGGSWLAVARNARFAAVTNLRGTERKTRSRGALVRDFVSGDADPASYGSAIARDAHDYAGFHLLAGAAGGEVHYIAPELQTPLAPGVHAFSNAPTGEHWPKMAIAAQEMEAALRRSDVASMLRMLMEFLRERRGTQSFESEVFITGDRYGTRASTVIVVTESEILFAEQSFTRGGALHGNERLFRMLRGS